MKYFLVIIFPESTTTVQKEFKNEEEAEFWMRLCLDICGKDERGRLFTKAMLCDRDDTILMTLYPPAIPAYGMAGRQSLITRKQSKIHRE